MTFLKPQKKIFPQYKEYSKFLQKREGYKAGTASFFAKQMQDFNRSGLTPKQYFEQVFKEDERAAETFLNNFRQYNQFLTDQYFGEMNKVRWEIGRKYVKGAC
jgi:hypothetical protein